MHLTNYAINKESENFVFNEDQDNDDLGHKRSFTSIMKHLEDEGEDVEKIMKSIKDVIIKTVCTVQPWLSHLYRSSRPEDTENAMCFEILG
jgi:tubulin polyglutamylase TTLL6/13